MQIDNQRDDCNLQHLQILVIVLIILFQLINRLPLYHDHEQIEKVIDLLPVFKYFPINEQILQVSLSNQLIDH